jgi:hypothetical protein
MSNRHAKSEILLSEAMPIFTLDEAMHEVIANEICDQEKLKEFEGVMRLNYCK